MYVIVVEGVDGAGKSKIANFIVDFLTSKNIRAKYVHFPDANSVMGSHIYSHLNGDYGDFKDMNYKGQWMLYALDRYEWYLQNKEDFENSVIICDRYATSSMIYQTVSMYRRFIFDYETFTFEEWLRKGYVDRFISDIEVTEYNCFGLPRPIEVFFVDTSEDVARSRTTNAGREKPDQFESDSNFTTLVYKSAQHMCNKNKWIRLPNDDEEDLAMSLECVADKLNRICIPVSYLSTLDNKKSKDEETSSIDYTKHHIDVVRHPGGNVEVVIPNIESGKISNVSMADREKFFNDDDGVTV